MIRHGETSWNKDYVIQGRIDIPLNEKGIEQAKIAREKVKGIPFSLCYCSPLSRAIETAKIVCEGRNMEIVIEPRLIEMAYGEYEGVSRSDETYLRQRVKVAHRYKGGESYLDVAQRVFNFLDELKGNHIGEDVLLVCHGGLGRLIRAYFLDEMENDDFFFTILKNAEVERFEFPSRDIKFIEPPRNH